MTDEQLLLLNTFIYFNGVKKARTVEDLLKCDGDVISLTPEEVKEVRAIARAPRNAEFLKMKITNFREDEYGGRYFTVVDSADGRNATTVMRGTGGEYEWHDNGNLASADATVSNREAARYVRELPGEYETLTVTGHSKGGNKAQYVALTEPRVTQAVSFDGPGFSEEFLKEHGGPSPKITAINAEKDIVSALLISAAGTTRYIACDEKNLLYNHKPNVMLKNIDKQGERSPVANGVNKIVNFHVKKMSEPQINALMLLLENKRLKNGGILAIGELGAALVNFFAAPPKNQTVSKCAPSAQDLIEINPQQLDEEIAKYSRVTQIADSVAERLNFLKYENAKAAKIARRLSEQTRNYLTANKRLRENLQTIERQVI
ncbi:MAG: DUF2974 domain-containing protein [Lactobacillales bacterium]|jgi:hypothetical protein|nr:DUF2974 domain-containing protein [Lactobacillales bacterium]